MELSLGSVNAVGGSLGVAGVSGLSEPSYNGGRVRRVAGDNCPGITDLSSLYLFGRGT